VSPLAAILANLDHLRRALDRAIPLACSERGHVHGDLCHALRDAADAVSDAQLGARHASSVVRDFRAFSRPAEETHVEIAVHAAVDRAVRLVSPRLRARAPVTTEFRDAPLVLGSESLLTT
jgi:hypothetical protein